MNRRKFLTTTGLLGSGGVIFFSLSKTGFNPKYFANNFPGEIENISDQLQSDFQKLIHWLKENEWISYLKDALNVNLELKGDDLTAELTKKLDANKLLRLRQDRKSGFDDFAGEQLIKPGFPAFSLLYHALASPRVKPGKVKAHPELEQIDLLENYIYALCSLKQLKQIYNIGANEELVLAVFAYEYRPAYKTPHHEYADLVFSRTGIGRIGNQPENYDKHNRCFVNQPRDPQLVKQCAVIPARYGLFLARKAKNNDIDLMKTGFYKPGDKKNDLDDEQRIFLQPIRKIFNNDLLTGQRKIVFTESHRSEKLFKLYKEKKVHTLNDSLPVVRKSLDLIVQDKTRNIGSSFLVISKHAPLIRHAVGSKGLLYFLVEKNMHDDRFFTSYNTQFVEDIELLEGNNRLPNGYDQPRNQALFVNITHEKENNGYKQLLMTMDGRFESVIENGGYYAPLFEDSICDGKVSVNNSFQDVLLLKGIKPKILPAFSIVTAPDFFPQVDSFDLLDFDIAPGRSNVSNFYEGGIASLATARLIPNPKSIDPGEEGSETYTAVLSEQHKTSSLPHEQLNDYKNPAVEKDYIISGFLPDASSSVFAPGWDITYSSSEGKIYLSTEGLGSPFIEDMKLCSAMNGMWPAASPDASRTYLGSFEKKYRNPTAIPLLDDELGYHKDSPHGIGLNTLGWDGEQGPFLELRQDVWKVNFTDLGRADCVQNALENKLDMSRLRKLKSNELISRMNCLKLCIDKLPKKNFESKQNESKMVGYTYHWLISAEKVNWGHENAMAYGIPLNLIGKNKEWISKKENAKISGKGYLFLFVDSVDDENKDWADKKRRRLGCDAIYVCQVTEQAIAWADITNGKVEWQV